jgi:predicted cupin superfamily sugar epimerase
VDLEALAARHDLAPHPEGGWFRETWRSKVTVETLRGPRSAGTSILFLVGGDDVSHLHRLAWDEVWHWHAGGTLRLWWLEDGGADFCDLDADHPQAVVPAGLWFGAEAVDWTLAACTMAPGFDPADFELGRRDELLVAHGGAVELIERLTRGRGDP